MLRLISLLRKLNQLVAWLEGGLLVALLLAMIILAASQIALRELFDSGISWADPTLRILVLWVGLFGAQLASREDHHIRIDLLSRYISPRLRCYTQSLTSGFTAVVAATVAWHGLRFVLLEREEGIMLTTFIPAWVAEVVIPFGFAMIALRYLVRAIELLLTPFRGATC